ncbi:hypothetical protein BJ508DRAFT_367951 [Ascobolus immersus RN42]|uniref:Multiprotein-bridging factor 1 n=1 Tax=Ascobolus immersus RN42 TaxID=1160509 RepID=A0A3N4H7G6_ASCIM|nr:hypothetical protein BJ508DRAFT_367951 [Ascobolus immersus RN42]
MKFSVTTFFVLALTTASATASTFSHQQQQRHHDIDSNSAIHLVTRAILDHIKFVQEEPPVYHAALNARATPHDWYLARMRKAANDRATSYIKRDNVDQQMADLLAKLRAQEIIDKFTKKGNDNATGNLKRSPGGKTKPKSNPTTTTSNEALNRGEAGRAVSNALSRENFKSNIQDSLNKMQKSAGNSIKKAAQRRSLNGKNLIDVSNLKALKDGLDKSMEKQKDTASQTQKQQAQDIANKMKKAATENAKSYIKRATSLSISKAVAGARRRKNMSQKELAVKINERVSVIADIESGRSIAVPSPAVLSKLELALGVSLRG